MMLTGHEESLLTISSWSFLEALMALFHQDSGSSSRLGTASAVPFSSSTTAPLLYVPKSLRLVLPFRFVSVGASKSGASSFFRL